MVQGFRIPKEGEDTYYWILGSDKPHGATPEFSAFDTASQPARDPSNPSWINELLEFRRTPNELPKLPETISRIKLDRLAFTLVKAIIKMNNQNPIINKLLLSKQGEPNALRELVESSECLAIEAFESFPPCLQYYSSPNQTEQTLRVLDFEWTSSLPYSLMPLSAMPIGREGDDSSLPSYMTSLSAPPTSAYGIYYPNYGFVRPSIRRHIHSSQQQPDAFFSSRKSVERPLTPPAHGWHAKYSSGVTGVVWDRVHQAWVVSWTLGGKRTFRHFTCKSYGGFDKARDSAIEFRLARNKDIAAYNKRYKVANGSPRSA